MKKLILLLIVIGFIAVSCEKNSNILVFKKKIEYKVTTNAKEVLVTYVDQTGATKMAGISSGEWKYEFKAKPNTYLYLQAKNMTDTGSVRVDISIGKDVEFSDENSFSFGAASTSGYVK